MSALLICLTIGLNDGWAAYPGSPASLNGHPSIRMTKEKIVVNIRRTYSEVDCRFWFQNDGEAASVEMGFPDEDSDSTEEAPEKSTFLEFASYVDGKRVRTFLKSAMQRKRVSFGPRQTRLVRNVYRVPHSDAPLDGRGTGMWGFEYVFSTGASWKGRIGKSELLITFSPDAPLPAGPLKLYRSKQWQDRPFLEWLDRQYEVVCLHPVRLNGRRVYMRRQDWRPTKEDDFSIYFGPHRRVEK